MAAFEGWTRVAALEGGPTAVLEWEVTLGKININFVTYLPGVCNEFNK